MGQAESSGEASGSHCFERAHRNLDRGFARVDVSRHSSEASAEQLALQQTQALLDEFVLNRAVRRQVVDDVR